MVVFRQIDGIRAKVVVIGKKLLYLGKSCCIREKVVLFGHAGLLGQKWL